VIYQLFYTGDPKEMMPDLLVNYVFVDLPFLLIIIIIIQKSLK
jgi:hypothetical protein